MSETFGPHNYIKVKLKKKICYFFLGFIPDTIQVPQAPKIELKIFAVEIREIVLSDQRFQF